MGTTITYRLISINLRALINTFTNMIQGIRKIQTNYKQISSSKRESTANLSSFFLLLRSLLRDCVLKAKTTFDNFLEIIKWYRSIKTQFIYDHMFSFRT